MHVKKITKNHDGSPGNKSMLQTHIWKTWRRKGINELKYRCEQDFVVVQSMVAESNKTRKLSHTLCNMERHQEVE